VEGAVMDNAFITRKKKSVSLSVPRHFLLGLRVMRAESKVKLWEVKILYGAQETEHGKP
jgi:hypothetical protein